MENHQQDEIRLTPDEWVAATTKYLMEENKELGKEKSLYSRDYKYIGMARIVAEFEKRRITHQELLQKFQRAIQ